MEEFLEKLKSIRNSYVVIQGQYVVSIYQLDELIQEIETAQQQVKVEPVVKPACETDKTQCKFCTRETTAEDFGFGKDRVCKSCLEKALANELRNMEQ